MLIYYYTQYLIAGYNTISIIMSSSDSVTSDHVDVTHPANKKQHKKAKKSSKTSKAKPALDVLSVFNIIDRTTIIKNDICSKLSKNVSDFSKISSKQLAECSLLKKQQLSDHLISLVSLCDSIPRASIELSSPSDSVIDQSKLESDIKGAISRHMDALNESNNFVFQTIQDQIKRLESLTKECLGPVTATSNPCEPPPSVHNPIQPASSSNLNLLPYIELLPEFISDSKPLLDYVATIDSEFEVVGERATIYLGEHDYHYTGKTHHARSPPEPIVNLISMINTKYPTKHVNSCLITKYKDGDSFCPSHEDNEDEINPESNIYTLSIGAERKMVFTQKSDNSIGPTDFTDIILPSRSLMVFSRISQEAWQHSIPPAVQCEAVRYSFTFRHISPHFVNSTVICGDSNTEKLIFGEEGNTFGKWMPGRRIAAYHVDKIPTPSEIGPHKNIILHVGINDIKSGDISHVPKVVDTLEQKSMAIMNAFPRSRVFICPLLPTKDVNKIAKVVQMNRGICR